MQWEWSQDVLTRARGAKAESMPFFELFALVTSANTRGHLWRGRKILIDTDCLPVAHAVNRAWTRSDSMEYLIRELADTSIRNSFQIKARHIPGITNTIPDLLSRDQQAQARALKPELLAGMDKLELPTYSNSGSECSSF